MWNQPECKQSEKCIQSALDSISGNNEDTLAEQGINARIEAAIAANPSKPGWLIANEIVSAELEAGYEAGTLALPTRETAIEWAASGTSACRCYEDES